VGGTAVITYPPEVVSSLDDPRLGISDRAMADFVHGVLSRLLGKTSGWRSSSDRCARLVAGIALVEPHGLDQLCPGLQPLGWPDAKHALRRLGLTPDEIDDQWSRSILLEGEERRARLPLELLTYLFPAELWKALALIIEDGSEATGRRFERWMRLVARGEGPCASRLSEASLKGIRTVFHTLLRHIQWLSGADEGFASIAEGWRNLPPPLDLSDLNASKARHDRAAMPRRAARRGYFELLETARRRERKLSWESHLKLLKPKRDVAALGTLTMTGARVESMACMTVSPQKRADGTYRTGGYVPSYVCPWDGEVRPALLFTNLKGQRDLFVVKVIPTELGFRIDDYLGYAGIDEDGSHPLWVPEWAYFDLQSGLPSDRTTYQYEHKSGRYEARVRRAAMDDDSFEYLTSKAVGAYTANDNPHAARKLAFQLAIDAAAIHIAEVGGGPLHLMRDQTPGHILLDHRLSTLASIYGDVRDLNSTSRQHTSYLLMKLMWEMLYGERGATFGLDLERITAARELVALVDAQLDASLSEVTRLNSEIEMLHDESHARQTPLLELRSEMRDLRAVALEHGAERMNEAEFRRLVLLGQELDERRDDILRLERRLVEVRDRERENSRRLTAAVAEARTEFDAAIAARVALPEPVREIPDVEAELARALETAPVGATADEDHLLVRRLLTLPEYSEAMDVELATLRVQMWYVRHNGKTLRFPEGDRRNNWFQPLDAILRAPTCGQHLWFVDWDALDKARYTPAQLARFRKALAQPYRTPRWASAAASVDEV
jgi:hypothetical protein